MSLTEEIIAACADDHTSLATILRKCLILASELGSADLKAWASKELEGYENVDELPSYRIMGITAKGLFLAGFGAQLNDQPLPSGNLDAKHRHWATTAKSMQGVSALEALIAKDPTGSARVYWPADMVAHYQTKFIEGYALNRAWQEIPIPGIVEIVDTVRTKVLKFVLELREKLGDVDKAVTSKPRAQIAPVVQNIFHTTVYGGTALVASSAKDIFTQSQALIVEGNFESLSSALAAQGMERADINQLANALEADAAELSLKKKTSVSAWITSSAKKLAKAAAGMTVDVAKATLTAYVSTYLGITPK